MAGNLEGGSSQYVLHIFEPGIQHCQQEDAGSGYNLWKARRGKKVLPSPHSADRAICSRIFQTMSVQSHHAAKDTDEFHAWFMPS